MSINYVASNGCTCVLNTTTTQATHPSLAFQDPNGVTQYVALTTSAIAGAPHVNISGTDYSMGVVPEVGGVRIHSNYVCIACAYNYNTTVSFMFCTDDNDYDFCLGLNPTYGTSSSGYATVTWNSKNCTGSSPTISEFFACMAAHATNASNKTYWETTMPNCWNYVNCCLAAGCDIDPKDGSSVLCTAYCICVADNCYWTQDTDFCFTSFNNHAAWSSCSWCKGCKPIGCWGQLEYASYNMNRTSGTMCVGNVNLYNCCCINYCNNNTYNCTAQSTWYQCSEENRGCWYCCGWLKCIPFPNACIYICGTVPSAVTVCTYAGDTTTGDSVNIVSAARSFSWSGSNTYYVIAQPNFRFGSAACAAITGQSWTYEAETDEYSCQTIRCACVCRVNTRWACANVNYSPSVRILGGRWSDGSTYWDPSYGYVNLCSCVLNCNCNWGDACRYVYVSVNCSCYGGSKSWQNFVPPSLVHCAW